MNVEHDTKSTGAARAWALPALLPLLLAVLLLALPQGAAAAEPAGRLISSVGSVTAIGADGMERPLARGDEVYPRETVVVGARASAQLRMRDEALIELEQESRFVIERYDYGDTDGDSAIMRFLRGVVRTVTGAIGKKPGDTYRMETPVATIGIRGTQYALQLCDMRCAREDRRPGLYGRVDEGAIAVTNRAASEVFTKNEYFYVADRDVAPEEIVRPPAGILDGGAVSAGTLEGVDDDLALEGELLDLDGGLLDATLTDTLALGGGLLDDGGALVGSTLTGTLDTSGSLLEGGGSLVDGTVDGVQDTTGILLDDAGNLLNLQ